jgi:uncharacterized protein (TIGR02466 family)
MNNQDRLLLLFAKPVLRSVVDIGDVDFKSLDWVINNENLTSKNRHVLKLPEFKNLKDQLYDCVCEYFYGLMQAKSDIEIYITESWVNKTEKGHSHHRHWHPNSLLSGVVYLDCDEQSGAIKFKTSQYDAIEYDVDQPNVYNSRCTGMLPRVGDVIIFPSGVEHEVEKHLGESPRYSLSFNTFIRGNISEKPLMSLGIK